MRVGLVRFPVFPPNKFSRLLATMVNAGVADRAEEYVRVELA
jgi:hypothetical protein